MRDARPPALAFVLALILACAPSAQAAKPAPRPAAKADSAQARGEPVDISGRVAVGLDKTFIKDQSQGYLMVQGLDLSRFAGRHILAKGLLLGQEQEYRVVRLLEYRVLSPDDDSPGAGGTVGQGSKAAPAARGKK
ncbi:MAG: hypothetical protein KKA55_10330 [Proteobacteria bacterium]|nr:hypothetical protein [Pseudomonadota bacterium]MBU1595914.1 hypothetical protein [Pseudomonadota bacterium]